MVLDVMQSNPAKDIILASTRPHLLCWHYWEIGNAISCKNAITGSQRSLTITNLNTSHRLDYCVCRSDRGVAKPLHTWARARATFVCALAMDCCSFKLVLCVKESARDRKKEEAE